MNRELYFGIEYGVFGGTLADQLKLQSLEFKDNDKKEIAERAKSEISFLCIHGFITDAECIKARNRLHNYIKKNIQLIKEEA